MIVRLLIAFLVSGLTQYAHAAEAPPTSVIVELQQAAAARWVAEQRQAGVFVSETALAAYRDELRLEQDRFLAELVRQGIPHRLRTETAVDGSGATRPVEMRYTLVLNAVNLHVPQDRVSALRRMPRVREVHRDRMLRLHLQGSVDYIRAPAVYGGIAELGPDDQANEGLEGQGMIISVIDTGIDWPHPMFGANPLPPRQGVAPETPLGPLNDKVVYSLSFGEIFAEDGFGHGTHVASTAAGFLAHTRGNDGLPATADDVALHGVAPQARLMSYKVCNDLQSTIGSLVDEPLPVFGCLSSTIVFSIEDSVSPRTINGLPKPVAQVINMSLGGGGGADSVSSRASDNAVLMGAIVVSSAGNSGPQDMTLGAPAAARRVIAVAAAHDPGDGPHTIDVLRPDGHDVDPDTAPILSVFATESNLTRKISQPIEAHYVDSGFADTPDQVPATVLGNICLAQRGSTVEADAVGTGFFAHKAAQCQAKGALAVLVYNNEPGPVGGVLAPSPIPVFTISLEDGQTLLDFGFDDTGLSTRQIRINPENSALFEPSLAEFSSRGPARQFLQVKPDVTGPGVNVLAAVPPASVLGALAASNYGAISGTSMSSPHVAGVAALLKQAHPHWNPDEVRTVLINTSTNLRSRDSLPAVDQPGLINGQGGGLVEVHAAVNAQALFGVVGDGLDTPTILGSHSFGEVPVINSRCVARESVDLVLRDLSGTASEYALRLVNDRNSDMPGVAVSLSASRLSLNAGGESQVSLTIDFDGSKLQDYTLTPIEISGYVVAESAAQTLRLPWYYRAVPAGLSPQTEVYSGTVLLGAQGRDAADGVSHVDIPFEVGADTVRIDAVMDFDEIIAGDLPDLDLYLLDHEGNLLASSATGQTPEFLSAYPVAPGTYTYRVSGYLNGPTPFEIHSTQSLAPASPRLEHASADSSGRVTLIIAGDSHHSGLEIERANDAGEWHSLGRPPARSRTISLDGQPGGEQRYRARALYAGKTCHVAAAPSAARTVSVRLTRAERGGAPNWPVLLFVLAGLVHRFRRP